MISCAHCHRKLTRPPVMVGGIPFGPRCAAAMYGAKPVRVRVERHPGKDERQAELPLEVRT